jgi:thiol-disulfide isomerase/thioredoxin
MISGMGIYSILRSTMLLLSLWILIAQGFPAVRVEGGVVSGVVKTSSGQPASGVRIAAAPAPDPTALVSITETDKEGRYSLENVPPGRVYISAGRVSMPTYYPGTLDVASGTVLTIAAGALVSGIDFAIKNESTGRDVPSPIAASQGVPKPLAVIQPAPEFSLKSVLGGEVNSTDLKGKVVVVEFWATWASPSKAVIPEYNRLRRKLKDQGVEFLGITYQSGSAEEIAQFVAQLQIEYPVVVGTDVVNQGFGGAPGFPTTFLVGKDWKVYRRILGQTADKIPNLEKDITALLAK